MSPTGSPGAAESGMAPRAAAAIDLALGDPFSDGAISFHNMVALDEREAYPEEACRALDELGVHRYYVPRELGGSLLPFDELAQIIRAMARRDLTVAIAHGKSFLGAIPIWIAGSDMQQRGLAEMLLRREQVALALTERDHGSDLLSIETAAERRADGYSLRGEKWLINNATRGRALTVLARTAADDGPRSSSLFFVDKRALSPGSFQCLPKIRTHGIRGADISGIRFLDAGVARDALVGAEGQGLEIALKGLLVTRCLIVALSLGAADTALRVALAFAESRKIRDRAVVDLPHPQSILADAFGDLLACEALATTAARSLHVVPEQASFFSAVAKFLVPTTVEAIIARLSVVLGARHYLREEHVSGVFQKIARDAALVSLFDGSTVVNLSALAMQLPRIVTLREKRRTAASAEVAARREVLFGFRTTLPRFDPTRLSLMSRADDVLDALPLAEDELARTEPRPGSDAARTRGTLVGLVVALRGALESEARMLTELERSGLASPESPEMFALAERYAALVAAGACVHSWLTNRPGADEFFAADEWLIVALARMLERSGRHVGVPADARRAVLDRLRHLARTNCSLSLVPHRLVPE